MHLPPRWWRRELACETRTHTKTSGGPEKVMSPRIRLSEKCIGMRVREEGDLFSLFVVQPRLDHVLVVKMNYANDSRVTKNIKKLLFLWRTTIASSIYFHLLIKTDEKLFFEKYIALKSGEYCQGILYAWLTHALSYREALLLLSFSFQCSSIGSM